MTAPDDPRWEHEEWDALAVGWVLSALDPDDEARFADHLPGCDRCTEIVRASLGTVAELAYAVPAETPPRRLKRRLLEAAAESQQPADPGLAEPGVVAAPTGQPPPNSQPPPDGQPPNSQVPPPNSQVPADGGPGAAPTREPANIHPLGSRPRRWVRRTAVAAGLVLIAALGAWNVELRSRQDDLQQIVTQRDALVARLTDAGPAEIAIIRGPGGEGNRYATVVVKQGRIGLITETLPPRSSPTTYWLWGLRSPDDKNPVPLAGFMVPKTRFSACNIEPPAGAADLRAFAISAEPGPQRPAKPTDLVGSGPATES
jgi:hypothetical protein